MSAPEKRSNKSTSARGNNGSNANDGGSKLMYKQQPSTSIRQSTIFPQTCATKSSTLENQIPSVSRIQNIMRSATTQDHQLRSATVQENAKGSADIDQDQPDKIVDEEITSLSTLNHEGFTINKFLIDSKNARDAIIERSRENTYRSAISVLQTKIEQSREKLANVPSILTLFEETVDYAHERIRVCEQFEKYLTSDYTILFEAIKENMEAIEEIFSRTKQAYDKNMDQEKLLQQKKQLNEQQLRKINNDLDFVTNARDNVSIQIIEADKILSHINPIIENIRQFNSKLEEEICVVRRKFETESFAMNDLTPNFQKWELEKIAENDMLKKEKAQLEKERHKIHSAVGDAKLENETMCKKINELKIEVDKQEQSVERIQNANKNLLEDKTEVYEFNEKRSMLGDSIRMAVDDTNALQAEMNKRQSQYNELMRIREVISKKKQFRSDLQQKLTEISDRKWKQEHKISIMEEFVNSVAAEITFKRARLSTTEEESLDNNGPQSTTFSATSKDFGAVSDDKQQQFEH